MASQENPSAILEATESFVCEIDGQRYTVIAGITRIAAGTKLAQIHARNFKPIESGLSFPEDETATANPGEHRSRQGKRSEAATAASTT